jgi:hypothetical protein
MSGYPRSSKFYSRQLGVRPGMLFTVRPISRLVDSARCPAGVRVKTPGPLPNMALQRTALPAAAERHDRYADRSTATRSPE